MRVTNLCKDLINEIILDYDLMIPRLTTSSTIDQSILLQVFKAVVPVDTLDKFNGQTDKLSVYQCMLNTLSQSLYIDLTHISSEKLAQGDPQHMHALLEILVAIKRFLHGESDQDDSVKRHNATFTIDKCGEKNSDEKTSYMNEKKSSSVSESGSESCSICFCRQVNESKCTRATDSRGRDVDTDDATDNGTRKVKVRKSRSPHHRYVDAREKKKLLLTGKRDANCISCTDNTSAASGASCTCSSHQLAKRLNQLLHLNEEVQCAEKQVSPRKCTSTSVSPDLIANPCTLSPGTKVQLERLFKSHQAFQRNIRLQVEKVQDSRQLLLQQLSMHSKTGNVNPATGKCSSCYTSQLQDTPLQRQQVNHQMNQNCTHQPQRNTSMIMSCVNPSLYSGNNYQRDLRSRLARITREIREKERQLTSNTLKTHNEIQRTIVKCAKSQVNRSKRELMAAREYVLQRNHQHMKREQLYLQSLNQLYDDQTNLLCSRAVALSQE